MKRWMLELTVVGMLAVLTACGGGTQTAGADSTGQNEANAESTAVSADSADSAAASVKAVVVDDKHINFEPAYAAVDDDHVKIEFTSLSMDIMNEGREASEYYEYKIHYTVTNKDSENDIGVYCSSSSIGQYAVQFANTTGTVKAGKIDDSAAFDCISSPNNEAWNSKGAEHISSVADLLDFEAELMISSMKDNTVLDSYTADVSFAGIEKQEGAAAGTAGTSGEADAAGNEEAQAASAVVKETNYMTIDGVYVDDSYSTSDNENMRFLYIFYTAHTNDKNMKIDSKSMYVTINDTNTYKAARSKKEIRYMRNYYNGAYLKEVYVGDEIKFVETFEIPKGELEPGRSITITKDQIPDSDKIKFTTDDIVHCESPEEVGELADPEGYEEEMWALEDADSETEAAVKNEINGYQWDVNTNSMTYQIEFWDPNNYELRTSFNTSGGTYEVKNGYIICTNDIGGTIEIPFTYEDGEVDVDVIAAFDFMK